MRQKFPQKENGLIMEDVKSSIKHGAVSISCKTHQHTCCLKATIDHQYLYDSRAWSLIVLKANQKSSLLDKLPTRSELKLIVPLKK